MSILYLATARKTEVVGGPVKYGDLDPITKDQFYERDGFIWLRDLPVLKQRYYETPGGKWIQIETVEDYPKRDPIPFPLQGGLSVFTAYIIKHLDTLGPKARVFDITGTRVYQIVDQRTGLIPHYFKSMGLKLWYRLFERDAFKLKDFSKHKRFENLEIYMRDTGPQVKNTLLNFKLKPGENRSIREYLHEH